MGKELREQQIDVIWQSSIYYFEKNFSSVEHMYLQQHILVSSGGSINSMDSIAN